MSGFAIQSIFSIISHFLFIYLAFWALQSLKVERCFKKGSVLQIQVLYILLAIVLGYIASSFFLDIIQLVKNIFI